MLSPLLDALPAIQVHVVAALGALVLGPVALYRQQRDRWHKVVGYLWVTSLVVTAISSFLISAQVVPLIGGFGPIHAFSVWALLSVTRAVQAIRHKQTRKHARIMRALYWQAIGVTGLLTLLPGRKMHAVFFGDAPLFSMGVIGVGVLAIVSVSWLKRPKQTKL